jgi:hypothetical protein
MKNIILIIHLEFSKSHWIPDPRREEEILQALLLQYIRILHTVFNSSLRTCTIYQKIYSIAGGRSISQNLILDLLYILKKLSVESSSLSQTLITSWNEFMKRNNFRSRKYSDNLDRVHYLPVEKDPILKRNAHAKEFWSINAWKLKPSDSSHVLRWKMITIKWSSASNSWENDRTTQNYTQIHDVGSQLIYLENSEAIFKEATSWIRRTIPIRGNLTYETTSKVSIRRPANGGEHTSNKNTKTLL